MDKNMAQFKNLTIMKRRNNIIAETELVKEFRKTFKLNFTNFSDVEHYIFETLLPNYRSVIAYDNELFLIDEETDVIISNNKNEDNELVSIILKYIIPLNKNDEKIENLTVDMVSNKDIMSAYKFYFGLHFEFEEVYRTYFYPSYVDALAVAILKFYSTTFDEKEFYESAIQYDL